MQNTVIESRDEKIRGHVSADMARGVRVDDVDQSSTLITFPGVSRNVPEWRRQLSQRVREVQERRAREAAEAAAAAVVAETVSCALPSGQLELVPDREQPSMNPIVSKALERVDRARRSDFAAPAFSRAATAPTLTAMQLAESEPVNPEADNAKHKLTVVSPSPKTEETKARRIRVIADGIEDPALSYLENCLTACDIVDESKNNQASFSRRFAATLLDVLFVLLPVAVVTAAIEWPSENWRDLSLAEWSAGIALAILFIYLTVSTALTGRTLGKRMCSLRIIDIRTRLIPTGGQSIKRAIAFIFSLAVGGIGIGFALIDRDGRTVHDRFSNTMVIHE